MSKIMRIALAFCVVLWTVTTCACADSSLRQTYKHWKFVKETLEKTGVGKGMYCNVTFAQTKSWAYLTRLFDWHKETGVLPYAWPRLSFYTQHLKALPQYITNYNSQGYLLHICITEFYNANICHGGRCKSCSALSDTWGDISKAICTRRWSDPDFPNPGYADESKEREKELVEIWEPPVSSPGPLTAEEVTFWIEKKLREPKESVAKVGEDCYAPPQLTMSLSYLRWLSEEANTTEKVAEELEAHPEFYAEKLRWLKGADPNTVSCDTDLLCGWDGFCVQCDYKVFNPVKEMRESCERESMEKWKAVHLPTPTHWKNHREAFKAWLGAFTKIRERSVDRNSTYRICSASVEQTISWGFLKELFHKRLVFDGVLSFAWPRISFYDDNLKEVLTEGTAENLIFCDWALDKDDTFLCVHGKCTGCREIMNKEVRVPKLYIGKCENSLDKPDEVEANKPREKELEGILKGPEGPEGILTLKEALSWNETLSTTASLGLYEECDVSPELTLSAKVLLRRLMETEEENGTLSWRWRTTEQVKEEMENNKTTYDEQLKWLKGLNNTRKFCGDKLVCGPDGVCIPCELLGDDSFLRVCSDLKEACEVGVPGRWDEPEYQSTTTEMSVSESGGQITRRTPTILLMIFISCKILVFDF